MLKIDWNILFNIVNVFVFYLLMRKFLFRPVTEIMQKRKNAVQASFDEADHKNKEAAHLKSKYEQALKASESDSMDILQDAKQRALEEQARIITAAKEDSLRIVNDAKKTMELERKLSQQDMQAEISELAILAAAKIIQKNMDDQVNHRIIQEFLTEVGAGE